MFSCTFSVAYPSSPLHVERGARAPPRTGNPRWVAPSARLHPSDTGGSAETFFPIEDGFPDTRRPDWLGCWTRQGQEAIPFWPSLGFGFIEVGTVTAHSQRAIPPSTLPTKPERALINRMGFNNHGSAAS